MAGRGPVSWQTVGKALVTATILAILLSRTDTRLLRAVIVDALGWWLAAGFAVSALLLVTSTLKWHALLRASGLTVPRRRLFAVYTIGFFVSAFLPGVIAGDVVRCHMAGRGWTERVTVAATILLERFTGVAVLVLMAAGLLMASTSRFATLPVVALVLSMGVAVATGAAAVARGRCATALAYRTRRGRVGGLTGALYRLHRTVRRVPAPALLVAGAYSGVFYLIGGLAFFLICAAFGIRITYLEATTVQVVICLLTVIPVSIGGLGIAQVGDVYLLGLLGVDPTSALGVSLVRQGVSYGYALLGGAFFIAWPRPSRDALPAPGRPWGGVARPSSE